MSFMVQGGYEFLKKDKGKLISKNINDFTVHILEYVSCIISNSIIWYCTRN